MGREAMATPRVSRLQKHILRVLLTEHHRTHGRTSMGHLELVKALGGDKSNISHGLRTLETRQTPPTHGLRLCIIKPTGFSRPFRECHHCFLRYYRPFHRKKANLLNDALA